MLINSDAHGNVRYLNKIRLKYIVHQQPDSGGHMLIEYIIVDDQINLLFTNVICVGAVMSSTSRLVIICSGETMSSNLRFVIIYIGEIMSSNSRFVIICILNISFQSSMKYHLARNIIYSTIFFRIILVMLLDCGIFFERGTKRMSS